MIEQWPKGSIGASRDERLIARIVKHFGPWALSYSVGELSRLDTGDFGNSDPRIQVANKTWGDRSAEGGSGPKKNH